MSYSINFSLKKNKKSTSLLLTVYKYGFDRGRKIIPHSANGRKWDKNKQRFKISNEKSNIILNNILDEIQNKAEKQILIWEKEKYNWDPKEVINHLNLNDEPKTITSEENKNTLIYWINFQIDFFKNKRRIKNGEEIIGTANADNYQWLKNTLERFTKDKYKKELASFKFVDIKNSFIEDYCLYIISEANKKGNNGGLSHKLKTLKATYNVANRNGIKEADSALFESVKHYMQNKKTKPRTLSKKDIQAIIDYDRTKLSKKEKFWLDLFIFSYYTGGMPNADVCYLKKSCIKEHEIVYTRLKCNKEATPVLLKEAKEILERYAKDTYEDYALPIFNAYQTDERKKRSKIEQTTANVNKTLKKIAKALGIKEDVVWYTARGTYITNMVEHNVNPYSIAKQAGNSPEIIDKHYYHNKNIEKKRQEARNALF